MLKKKLLTIALFPFLLNNSFSQQAGSSPNQSTPSTLSTPDKSDTSKETKQEESKKESKKYNWKIDRTTAPSNVEELKGLQESVKKTVEKVMPSTVGLFIGGDSSGKEDRSAAGSGVIVSEDGLILTAAHVIGEPNREVVVVLSDGKWLSGITLGSNKKDDSGMIKITDKVPEKATWPGAKEGKWPAVELGKTFDLKQGQYVVALGHHGGSVKGRKPPVRLGQFISVTKMNQPAAQTDCILVGGDSGGPLFDLDGKLVGIHSRIGADVENNMHVPIESFKRDWDKLLVKFGKDNQPPVILGVKFDEENDTSTIVEVVADTPADDAGILVGDKIVKFNGKKVEKSNDVYALLFAHKPNDLVTIELIRNGEKVKVEAALAKRKSLNRK